MGTFSRYFLHESETPHLWVLIDLVAVRPPRVQICDLAGCVCSPKSAVSVCSWSPMDTCGTETVGAARGACPQLGTPGGAVAALRLILNPWPRQVGSGLRACTQLWSRQCSPVGKGPPALLQALALQARESCHVFTRTL